MLATERELPMRRDQIPFPTKGDPPGNSRRLRRHALQPRTHVRGNPGTFEVQQVPQMRPERPEDRLWLRMVLPTYKLSGQRLQVLKQRNVNSLRSYQPLGVKQQAGGNRDHGLVELRPPHLLVPCGAACNVLAVPRWEQWEQRPISAETKVNLGDRLAGDASCLAKFDEVEV